MLFFVRGLCNMKRLSKQNISSSKLAGGGLPPIDDVNTLAAVSDTVMKHVEMHWLRPSDQKYAGLSDAYDSYLSSMGVEYSVGLGRVLLAVYTGKSLTFCDASGEVFTLGSNSVMGHLVSKRTNLIPENVLAHALEWRRQSVPPREIYERLKREVPLNWNVVDSLPEASRAAAGVAGFLSLVHVHPQLRQIGLSKLLMQSTLKGFLDGDNLGYAFAFARAPGFPKSGETDIQNYVLKKDSTGLHPDVGIRIHENVGQAVICGVPKGAVDSGSGGYAVLVASNLRELRRKKMI